MTDARHKIEVVIHVDEDLGATRQQEIASAVAGHAGVAGAHFAAKQRHLMLVDYDPDQVSAQQILTQVSKQHVHAELVGPM